MNPIASRLSARRASATPISSVHPEDTTGAAAAIQCTLLLNSVLVFLYTLTMLTSMQYLREFGIPARIAGVLIGALEFVAAACQPIQACLLRYWSLRGVLALFAALQVCGNVLYLIGPTSGVVALGFIGRSLIGSTGGGQVVQHALNRLVPADRTEKRFAVQRSNALFYQAGGAAGGMVASFGYLVSRGSETECATNNVTTADSSALITQSTLPAIFGIAASVCFGAYAWIRVPPELPHVLHALPGRKGEPVTRHTARLRAVVGGLAYLISCVGEGSRQVTLFALAGRIWQDLHPAAIGQLSGFLFFTAVLSFPLDNRIPVAYRKWSLALCAVSFLAIVPWTLPQAASIPLFCLGSVVFVFAVRNSTGYAALAVSDYAAGSTAGPLILLVFASLTGIGIGTGAVIATVFEGSIIPALVISALMFACAVLQSAVS